MAYQVSTAIPRTDTDVCQNITTGSGQLDQMDTRSSPSYSATQRGFLASVTRSTTSPTNSSTASPPGGMTDRLGILKNTNHGNDQSINTSLEPICRRLDIDTVRLVSWMENLRLWISQTILRRTVEEIEQTNQLLIKHGMAEEQIGKIGLDKLRKVANLPHILERIPSLDALLPFLEFTNQQEYLVQRLSQLAEGGAISDYRWNAGGRYKGNEWTEKLPTDSDIIMNCLAAYLDIRMPKHYHYTSNVDAKPFTGIYFLKAPELLKNGNGDVATKQESVNPKASKLSFFSNLLAFTKSTTNVIPPAQKTTDSQMPPSQQYNNFAIVQTAQKPPHFVLKVNSPSKSGLAMVSSANTGSLNVTGSTASSQPKNGETLEVEEGEQKHWRKASTRP